MRAATAIISKASDPEIVKNRTLFFGNNLKVLREKFPSDEGYFDLVYLDPPFNSKRGYNVLFKEGSEDSQAQIQAFEDTWHWNADAKAQFEDLVGNPAYPEKISDLMLGMEKLVGHNDVMAYLTMMTVRLIEIHRVLKETGSLYLHCDPTASHYLKLVLDAIFGHEGFRNEIIWRRTGAHNKLKRYGPIHDTIFFYTKSKQYTWTNPKRPYMNGHVEEFFIQEDGKWRTNYFGNVLTGSGLRGGESGKPWKGIDPSAKGRHWAIPGALIEEVDEDLSELGQHEKLDRLYELGYITIDPNEAWPMYQHYLQPNDGQSLGDIWAFQPYTRGTVFGTDDGIDEDVRWLSTRDQERLGYSTQKPEGLLRRIIEASTKKGDWVLDPFGGCGTTAAVAEKTERNWVIIDVTTLAINLVKRRIEDIYPDQKPEMTVEGYPADMAGAAQLFTQDAFEFEYWACDLVNARPAGDKKKGKMKGADKGVDGVITYADVEKGETRFKKAIVQVKGGGTKSGDIRDFRGTIAREKVSAGVFITMHAPTKAMQDEAVEAGTFTYALTQQKYPVIQIMTVEELLAGKKPNIPNVIGYAKQALASTAMPEQSVLMELAVKAGAPTKQKRKKR